MPDNNTNEIQHITPDLSWTDRLDHLTARFGFRRSQHRILPGLYAINHPAPESPVFATANYTLSYDALRSSLKNIDGYILVLDTQGINVWCAAGKGTFGTDELVRKIEEVDLKSVVSHRTVILPQLGAPGISAHEVKKRTGFKVEYGPVRAADIPAYMITHTATLEMRQVTFGLIDRVILIPVELANMLLPILGISLVLWILVNPLIAKGFIASALAGLILFPILLPWLPSEKFSTKGFYLGILVAIPFLIISWFDGASINLWQRSAWLFVIILGLPAITAYLALNFTGATPCASRSGVEREIKQYIPVMAWSTGLSMVLLLGLSLVKYISG